MVIATLTWTEPVEGQHLIAFPDGSEEEIAELDEYLSQLWGGEYGDTIADVDWERRAGGTPDPDPWGDLALNVRYTTGEGLYEADVPVFARRGIARQ